ncbi:hypothetical protein PLICRDRAFT_43803 [Plicaturopsis crispa FD-325 SS-3]|nr:hypothetical protein PLICRDRAFT_43803 [Plicaturopsis crispa FD-325 SS-3]
MTSNTGTGIGSKIKGGYHVVHGLGETIRGEAMSNLDRATGDAEHPKGLKNTEIAQSGHQEWRQGLGNVEGTQTAGATTASPGYAGSDASSGYAGNGAAPSTAGTGGAGQYESAPGSGGTLPPPHTAHGAPSGGVTAQQQAPDLPPRSQQQSGAAYASPPGHQSGQGYAPDGVARQ